MKSIKGPSKITAETEVAEFQASRLGQQLVTMGKISEEDISRILVAQREQGLLFGEAAVVLGLLTQAELVRALSQQYQYPYVEVGGSGLSQMLEAAHRPFGTPAEVFRALRSQLVVRWFNGVRKTIAITAPRARQGTSSIAANLAVCFAQLGEKTLLVDANFRNPKQHEIFACKNTVGLSNVLSGRADLRDSVVKIAPFNCLSVMPAGPNPPNPQELLNRAAFAYLVETAPAAFDITIIDTPPILEYADAQIVGAFTRGCLLVTRRNRTRIADIELAKGQISPTGADIVGTVINE